MPTANVLDMFHGDNHEKIPDFAGLASRGVFAIIHKCTQGTHYTDPRFKERRKAALDAGLLFAAYHFLDASEAKAQADFFITSSGVTNAGTFSPLAADYEKNNRGGTASLRQLYDFMGMVDAVLPAGLCELYSGDLIRETLRPHVGGHMDMAMQGHQDFFRKHRLWLAEYGPHENIPWPWSEEIKTHDGVVTDPAPGVFLWQFSDRGAFAPFLTGNVDCNYYAGTREQLQAAWAA